MNARKAPSVSDPWSIMIAPRTDVITYPRLLVMVTRGCMNPDLVSDLTMASVNLRLDVSNLSATIPSRLWVLISR